jgi:hypothetical protein
MADEHFRSKFSALARHPDEANTHNIGPGPAIEYLNYFSSSACKASLPVGEQYRLADQKMTVTGYDRFGLKELYGLGMTLPSCS